MHTRLFLCVLLLCFPAICLAQTGPAHGQHYVKFLGITKELPLLPRPFQSRVDLSPPAPPMPDESCCGRLRDDNLRTFSALFNRNQ